MCYIGFQYFYYSSTYDLAKEEVLVIGYDVAHPPPVMAHERRLLSAKGISADSLDPSVVGVSFFGTFRGKTFSVLLFEQLFQVHA